MPPEKPFIHASEDFTIWLRYGLVLQYYHRNVFIPVFLFPLFLFIPSLQGEESTFEKNQTLRELFFLTSDNFWRSFCFVSLPLTCNNCFFLLSILEIVRDFFQFLQTATSDSIHFPSGSERCGKKKQKKRGIFHKHFFLQVFSTYLYYAYLLSCIFERKENLW